MGRIICPESERGLPVPETVTVLLGDGGRVSLFWLPMPSSPNEVRNAAGQGPGVVALLRTPSWRGWLPVEIAAEDVLLLDRVEDLQSELLEMSRTWGLLVDRYHAIAGRGAGLAVGFAPACMLAEALLLGAAWENVKATQRRLYGDAQLFLTPDGPPGRGLPTVAPRNADPLDHPDRTSGTGEGGQAASGASITRSRGASAPSGRAVP